MSQLEAQVIEAFFEGLRNSDYSGRRTASLSMRARSDLDPSALWNITYQDSQPYMTFSSRAPNSGTTDNQTELNQVQAVCESCVEKLTVFMPGYTRAKISANTAMDRSHHVPFKSPRLEDQAYSKLESENMAVRALDTVIVDILNLHSSGQSACPPLPAVRTRAGRARGSQTTQT